jgi:hypothetical protein
VRGPDLSLHFAGYGGILGKRWQDFFGSIMAANSIEILTPDDLRRIGLVGNENL